MTIKRANPPMPGRWRRRFILAGMALLALGLLSRLVVAMATPSVIRRVAAHYGLNSSYERMELYLLSGDVGFWHFTLTDTGGGRPLVQADYARCHISTLDLLTGRLTVRRLEAEGVDVLVERKPDGTVPLLSRFAAWTSGAVAPRAQSAESQARQIDFSGPLEVDAFRLSSVHAHIVDEAVSPPLDAQVELNLRLADMDSTVRPTKFEMDLSAPPLLDLLHVDATGRSQGQSLDAELHVQAKGVHPIPAAGYLLPMGIRPTSGNVSLAMNGHLSVRPSSVRPGAVAIAAALDGIQAVADGEEAAAIDRISANADAVDFNAAHIGRVSVQGGRCFVRRDERGETGVAGFQIVQPQVLEEQLSVPLAAALDLIPQHWGIDELTLQDLQATLQDRSLSPPVELPLKINDLTFDDFSPDHPGAITLISGRLAAQGIAGRIRIDGQAQPFTARKEIDLHLLADQIRPEGLRPYLETVGLEPDMGNGKLTADFHGDVVNGRGGALIANARLSNIILSDKQPVLVVNSIGIAGAVYNPLAEDALLRGGGLRIQSIEISGPNIATRRQVDGALAALGLRTKLSGSKAGPIAMVEIGSSGETSPPPSSQREFVVTIPTLSIDRLVWKDIGVQFDDARRSPETSLAISDAGLELTNLTIALDQKRHGAVWPPGRIHAWLNAPRLAQSIVADGDMHCRGDGISTDLSIDGQGITADGIADYFSDAPIRPVLRDGSFHVDTEMSLTQTANGIDSDLAVRNFSFKEGGEELASVGTAAVSGISVNNGTMRIASVGLLSPHIAVSRETDGAILVGGVRIEPNRPAPAAADRLAQIYQSAPAAKTGQSAITMQALACELKEVKLNDASIDWTDRAVQPPVTAHVTVLASARNVNLGQPVPAQVNVWLHEDHALDRMSITGVVTPSLTSPSATLEIAGEGIHAAALNGYLAPYATGNLKDGQFHATVDAGLSPSPDGGTSAHLIVTNLGYRDGQDGALLCKLDALRLTASRIDPAGKTIAIDEIGVDGLDASAMRAKDGTIRLLGLTVGGVHSSVTPAQALPAATVSGVVGINKLAQLAETTYPLVTVKKLDIGVRQIAITDESRPNAKPLAIAGLRLWNEGDIQLLGDNAQTRPPMDLRLSGAVDPLIGSIDADARIAPFAQPATATVDVNLAGVRGTGITDLFPELAGQLDGRDLTDGRLNAKLSLQLKRHVADPLDLDFNKDFSLEASLKNVTFRQGADGPVLAGLDEAACTDVQVVPSQAKVTVGEVDITNPAARVWRNTAGIHVLGIIVKPSFLNSNAAAPAPSSVPGGEIAINRVVASGLDFNFEDRTCNPPLEAPLSGLDLEVRGLSSRMMQEDKSCRFSVLINSGKVRLPARGGGWESRDLFSQAEASGIVGLYPKPTGWVKASISGLDLSALSGEAKQAGVTLGGGTFDGSVDLRLRDQREMDAHVVLGFTDLSVSEPPDGPITRGLNVNAPLDVVIAALQDQDGSITIPLDVPIRAGQVSVPAVALSAGGALAGVVATSVATTPLKASDAVLSIFGDTKLPRDEQPVTLTFAPGDESINQQDLSKLGALLRRAQDDSTLELTLHHALGGGDALRAAVLANPTLVDCANLAYSLRLKKINLLAERDAAEAQARAELASGFGADSSAAVARVAQIDVTLAATEDALDEVYDRLRPGADRQADRRTRAACIQIAQDRLSAVQNALLASRIEGLESRIKVTHATFSATGGGGGGVVVVTLNHKKAD